MCSGKLNQNKLKPALVIFSDTSKKGYILCKTSLLYKSTLYKNRTGMGINF